MTGWKRTRLAAATLCPVPCGHRAICRAEPSFRACKMVLSRHRSARAAEKSCGRAVADVPNARRGFSSACQPGERHRRRHIPALAHSPTWQFTSRFPRRHRGSPGACGLFARSLLQSCRGALGLAGDGAILTPDLLVGNRIVRLAQISIAAALVLRRTCPLAGLGLAGLYVFGVTRYRVFYMTDYVFFLGFAAYLILSSPRLCERPAIRGWRVPILVVIIHGVSRLQLSARPEAPARGGPRPRSPASTSGYSLPRRPCIMRCREPRGGDAAL